MRSQVAARPGGWAICRCEPRQIPRPCLLSKSVRRHFAKHEIRPLTLHSARHTWATLAPRAGKSIRWIAEQLGHSDPAITLRIYAHVLPDEGEDLGFLDFTASCSTSNSLTTGKSASVSTIAQRREVAE